MKPSNRMSVLLVSPIGGVAGGISRWTEKIINYYSTENTDNIELKHFNSARVHYVNPDKSVLKRVFWGIVDGVVTNRKFRTSLRASNCDVVHIISSGSLGLFSTYNLLKIIKKSRKKIVLHIRFGRIPDLFNKGGWEFRILKKVLDISDTIIVLDKSSEKTLLSYGYTNVERIANPITTEVMSIIEKEHIQREPQKLVFAGHVIKTKGVIELAKATTAISNLKIVFVGWYQEEIKHQILDISSTNSSNSVLFTGQLSLKDTIREMLSANIFVLPSYTEGFPNVILESMACGCPIITTGVGAIPEMLDFENGNNYGICVNPQDFVGLQKAIETMLSDFDFAMACGQNAKKRVHELYTMPVIWKELVRVWRTV